MSQKHFFTKKEWGLLNLFLDYHVLDHLQYVDSRFYFVLLTFLQNNYKFCFLRLLGGGRVGEDDQLWNLRRLLSIFCYLF